MDDCRLLLGDCLERMKEIEDGSVDAIVTDPPAGIGFIGMAFDHDRGGRDRWVAWLAERMAEALRVARPGAYALAWALPRTSHWTATAIEDAGWTIRDCITHLNGQSFPKSKACLKGSSEHWWLARKTDRYVTPLQIDACRIAAPGGLTSGGRCVGSSPNPMNRNAGLAEDRERSPEHPAGRWPSNVVLSHSRADCDGRCAEDCPVALLDRQSGKVGAHADPGKDRLTGIGYSGGFRGSGVRQVHDGDSGGASRFFPTFPADPAVAEYESFIYAAKASRKDRGEGNSHPTVKSQHLMRWLVRLIARPGDLVADPFLGSGSTGVAALAEGMRFLGVEQDADYYAIAERRIREARAALPLFADPA